MPDDNVGGDCALYILNFMRCQEFLELSKLPNSIPRARPTRPLLRLYQGIKDNNFVARLFSVV